jgi:hypothetical protein
MKVTVHTREDGVVEHDVTDGTIELRLRDGDPEFPARYHVYDVVSIEVEGHPEPITQTAPEQEAEWVTPSRGELAFGAATLEKLRELPDYDPRLDEPSGHRYRRVVEPKAPAKKKAAK